MQTSSQAEGKVREKGKRVTMQSTAKVLDNPFEGWTTVEDAADIVGRSKQTLYSWVKAGKISCYSVGKRMRVVNIEEVREFSQKNPPPRLQPFDKNE